MPFLEIQVFVPIFGKRSLFFARVVSMYLENLIWNASVVKVAVAVHAMRHEKGGAKWDMVAY